VLKRLLDIAGAAAALWVLFPFLLVVSALVKLTSPGTIFFRQLRVGLHGKKFHMLKFRSMVADAEALKAKLAAQNEQAGPVFKMKRDPRVTPLGRILRKYSIDELPQLVNVLRGDMTLVGPPSGAAGGREVRAVAAAPPFGSPGSHLHLAGQRPERDLLRAVDVHGPPVHRQLELPEGRQPDPQDLPGRPDRSRSKLARNTRALKSDP
jgi:hypothetical protein